MHIPDGFLSVAVSIVFWVVSLIVVGYALKRVNRDLGERQVPLMGVLAACIFAGQMLNFSVTGGTSGHLLGAAIATILLGPWAAILVLTCVVGIQALIFQDGGLLALGANIFNMGVIGVTVAYFVYRTIQRFASRQIMGRLCRRIRRRVVVYLYRVAGLRAATGAFGHVAGQRGRPGHGRHPRSDRHRRRVDHRRRAGVSVCHSPRFVPGGCGTAGGRRGGVGGGIGHCGGAGRGLAAGLVTSRWAGVGRRAKGLSRCGAASRCTRSFRDYVLPGVSNAGLATILAGILGALIVFGVALAVAYVRRNRRNRDQ